MFFSRKWTTGIVIIAILCIVQPLLAAILSIPFFSQRDPQWSSKKLGTCSVTIGSDGCAMTCVSMALSYRGANVDPAKLNSWLTSNAGYSGGCDIKWDVAARYGGTQWMRYQGSSTLPNLQTLSADLDAGKLIIAKSNRFSSHFVIIRGVTPDRSTGYYWDPYDTVATQRRIGDGWVNIGTSTRVYTRP